jgi:hypothetical protein
MIFREKMNASVLVVILLLELLFITISHAFIIIVPTTTHLRPVVVRSINNEVGILLSNKFGTTTSTRSALEASSSSKSTEVEVDFDAYFSDKLTPKEKYVYTMLKELSNSNLLFRIVVVGNGAILESTNLLGSSSMKLNQSPVSGANIVTFASSNNQSFEFHLMIGQIDKVAFIEKDSPINKGKTMRIIRFINDESGTSKSICSLILATSAADGVDDDDDTIANDWFKIMISKYGSEHTFLN